MAGLLREGVEWAALLPATCGSKAERAAMPVSGGRRERLAGGVRGKRDADGGPVDSQPMCEERDPVGGGPAALPTLLGAITGVRFLDEANRGVRALDMAAISC